MHGCTEAAGRLTAGSQQRQWSTTIAWMAPRSLSHCVLTDAALRWLEGRGRTAAVGVTKHLCDQLSRHDWAWRACTRGRYTQKPCYEAVLEPKKRGNETKHSTEVSL